MKFESNLFGYKPANQYQCINNFIKPDACNTCDGKPLCQETFDLSAINQPIVGFKHSAFVNSDCIDVGDGIVRFSCGPVDLSADGITHVHLRNAISKELRGVSLDNCSLKNPDVQTVILECNILLDSDEHTLTHTGQESITALILADGTSVEFTERLCEQKDVFFFENFIESADQATIEAAIEAAGLTFESVVIEAGAIPANDPTPALDKVTITTCDTPFIFEGFKFCGDDRVFTSGDEVATVDTAGTQGLAGALEAAAKTTRKTTYKKKEDYVAEATDLGIDTSGTVPELMARIDAEKARLESDEEE